MAETSRREFLGRVSAWIAALCVAPLRAAFALPAANGPIDPATNASAKALQYVADANSSADRKKKSDGAKQFCDNCMFYVADPAKKDFGKCQVITGGLVAAKGWCITWALDRSKR